MRQLRLQEWTMEEQEQLIHFMTTNTWPFHGNANPAREIIEKTIEEGGYESDDVKTFWIIHKENTIGLVKLFDLQDDIPVFDLRIAEGYRGYGYGPASLKLVVEYIFTLPEKKIRIEGHTRQDNFAMRKTFERAGFVKEAHLRQAWYSPKENKLYDAITYGMTREDFEQGKITPVVWRDELPYANENVNSKEQRNIKIEPTIQTNRLHIKSPQIEHSKQVLESISYSLNELKPWLHFAQVEPTLTDVETGIIKAENAFSLYSELRFHLFEKETSRFIGTIDFYDIDWEVKKMTIRFWLDARFEGKGLMTEAVEKLTEESFDKWGIQRLQMRCESENIRSRAVAERLDFELEGILRQESLSADRTTLTDTCIYAKIKR